MSSIERAREELYKLSGKDRFEVMAEKDHSSTAQKLDEWLKEMN